MLTTFNVHGDFARRELVRRLKLHLSDVLTLLLADLSLSNLGRFGCHLHQDAFTCFACTLFVVLFPRSSLPKIDIPSIERLRAHGSFGA